MAATLRIVSANLWNGRAHPEAFAELVEALHADVVAVQELGAAQADALGRVLPHGHLEPADDHCGMGIAARAPVSLSRIPISRRDARVAHLACEEWDALARPLEIINLHLAAPHVLRPRPGLWLRRVQLRELEAHLDQIGHGLEEGPGDARVLVGDFNATPAWPAYQRIAARFSDAAIAAAQRRGRVLQRTWGPWSGAPRLLRIDHAMVRDVEVHAFQVVAVAGSDHSAVVVDVQVEADA